MNRAKYINNEQKTLIKSKYRKIDRTSEPEFVHFEVNILTILITVGSNTRQIESTDRVEYCQEGQNQRKD